MPLDSFLQENLYEGNEQSALSKAEDIHLAIEMGDGLRGAVNELKRHDHHFDESQHSQELLNILKRLHNNTRTRENNRLTPKELNQVIKEQNMKRVNIGRNDPCYCGSGKKYKKCCLKKDKARK